MADAREINQMLVNDVEAVASMLLPQGKRDGNNWRCGDIDGNPGGSLSVSLSGGSRGVWSDFATGDKGDLLDLWQKSKKITFVETLKEAGSYLGVVETRVRPIINKNKRKPVSNPRGMSKPRHKGREWLHMRRISDESITAYKIMEQGADGSILVFPFLSPAGDLELVKYRDISILDGTKKKIWSNEDPDYHLWGWQAISPDATEVVLAEGEIDSLSWHTAGFPSLSVPQGAGGKQDIWISNDFDRLARFRTIYVSMDMDAAGQGDVADIVNRLGRERCKVVDLGNNKDSNEALMLEEDLKKYITSAKTMDPPELFDLCDCREEIEKEFAPSANDNGIKLPWGIFNTEDAKTILRPGETSVWAGINGHGKTTSLCQVTVHAIWQQYVTCTASMETPRRKLGKKMIQQISGSSRPSPRQLDDCFKFLGGKTYVVESIDRRIAASKILEDFAYAARRYNAQLFIVDSLSKCGLREDDYNGQKDFIDDLEEFAKKYLVHVVIVMHIRKGVNETEKPNKFSVKGTGALTDMACNLFLWWRDKSEGDRISDAVITCAKQRETGIETAVSLNFDRASTRHYRREDEFQKYI